MFIYQRLLWTISGVHQNILNFLKKEPRKSWEEIDSSGSQIH